MLFNLPIILSGNLKKINLLFPKLFLETSRVFIGDCYIRIMDSKLTALLEYK